MSSGFPDRAARELRPTCTWTLLYVKTVFDLRPTRLVREQREGWPISDGVRMYVQCSLFHKIKNQLVTKVVKFPRIMV